MNDTKIIVICGYPRSGTTWLSRLVAELLDCPLKGNWGFSRQLPQDVEGLGRRSDYECYKSHHRLSALTGPTDRQIHRLLYVVRDPRDVAISASHHFDVPFPTLRTATSWLPAGARVYGRLSAFLNRGIPRRLKKRRFIDAVMHGDPAISEWLAVPWREHVRPFRTASVPIVRYEDLLNDPVSACTYLLASIGVDKAGTEVRQAIAHQAFDKRKQEFKDRGQSYEYRFLRRGQQGYWRREFTAAEKREFTRTLGEDLQSLSYELR